MLTSFPLNLNCLFPIYPAACPPSPSDRGSLELSAYIPLMVPLPVPLPNDKTPLTKIILRSPSQDVAYPGSSFLLDPEIMLFTCIYLAMKVSRCKLICPSAN